MFILFGFGRRRVQNKGAVVACTCPRCHNEVTLSLLHVSTWFTLFFIPVIPYSRKRFLSCPVCAWSLPVANGTAPAIDEMTTITQTWRDGGMDNEDYGKRIDAFWSHVVPEAAA